jgi:hypothetical protein
MLDILSLWLLVACVCLREMLACLGVALPCTLTNLSTLFTCAAGVWQSATAHLAPLPNQQLVEAGALGEGEAVNGVSWPVGALLGGGSGLLFLTAEAGVFKSCVRK